MGVQEYNPLVSTVAHPEVSLLGYDHKTTPVPSFVMMLELMIFVLKAISHEFRAYEETTPFLKL
jgi:hypothetical protein